MLILIDRVLMNVFVCFVCSELLTFARGCCFCCNCWLSLHRLVLIRIRLFCAPSIHKVKDLARFINHGPDRGPTLDAGHTVGGPAPSRKRALPRPRRSLSAVTPRERPRRIAVSRKSTLNHRRVVKTRALRQTWESCKGNVVGAD